jgi:hypothetical protein
MVVEEEEVVGNLVNYIRKEAEVVVAFYINY